MSTPISAMMHSTARLSDPGDGVEVVAGLDERGHHLVHLDVESGDSDFAILDHKWLRGGTDRSVKQLATSSTH
jgi:hypothetical protein